MFENIIMKKLLFVSILLSLLSVTACKKKEATAALNVNFTAEFNHQKIALKTEYTDSVGYKYKFEKFKYFLSNIRLVKENNTEVKLADIVCVDYNVASTQLLQLQQLPVGKYTKLKFGVGLTPEQNNVLPADAPANDPRQTFDELYWGWLKYIFIRVDGRSDVDGSNKFNNLLVYDVGTDELYRAVEIAKNIELKAGDNTATLNLNINQIFRNGTNDIDISNYEESYTHSDKTNNKNFDTAIKFADNFSKAFSFE